MAFADEVDPDGWRRAVGRALARTLVLCLAGGALGGLATGGELAVALANASFGSVFLPLTLVECWTARRWGGPAAAALVGLASVVVVPLGLLQALTIHAGGALSAEGQAAAGETLARHLGRPRDLAVTGAVVGFVLALGVLARRRAAAAGCGGSPWIVAGTLLVGACLALPTVLGGLVWLAMLALVLGGLLSVGDALEGRVWRARHAGEGAVVAARLARGDLPWGRAWLLAYLGDGPAFVALGRQAPRDVPRGDAHAWARGLEVGGAWVVQLAAAELALLALATLEARAAARARGADGARAAAIARARDALRTWLRARRALPAPSEAPGGARAGPGPDAPTRREPVVDVRAPTAAGDDPGAGLGAPGTGLPSVEPPAEAGPAAEARGLPEPAGQAPPPPSLPDPRWPDAAPPEVQAALADVLAQAQTLGGPAGEALEHARDALLVPPSAWQAVAAARALGLAAGALARALPHGAVQGALRDALAPWLREAPTRPAAT